MTLPADLALPPAIAEAVSNRWPDSAPQWCKHVETELAELCSRYRVRPTQVMPARFGYVIAAEGDGRQLVLRASPDPCGAVQAAVYRALAALGVAPTVHEIQATASGTWTVTDRVLPGVPVKVLDPAEVDPARLAAAIAPLAGHPTPVPDAPSIVDWLRDRLTDDRLTELPPGESIAPVEQRRNALVVLDHLSANMPHGLCHGDASTWNLLTRHDGAYLLVDPRGVTGEAAYDIAVVALKTAANGDVAGQARLLAELAGIDAERARQWAIVADAARV